LPSPSGRGRILAPQRFAMPVQKRKEATHELQGRARHSVRAEAPFDRGAQRTDAPYQGLGGGAQRTDAPYQSQVGKAKRAQQMSDVTHILNAIEQGDPKAATELLPLVYGELRKLAASKMANEAPGQTLQPTALVHEAWLRLAGNEKQAW